MTVLSVLVDAVLGSPDPVAALSLTVAVTVPGVATPVTATLYVDIEPPTGVTTTFVAPDVPPTVTSVASNPVTLSLNIAVKLIVVAEVGSAWPAAWLIVTVGRATVDEKSAVVTLKKPPPDV